MNRNNSLLTTEEAVKVQDKIRSNPTIFSSDFLGTPAMEEHQEKALCDIMGEYDRVAISSAHGLGKTYLLSEVVLACLFAFAPEVTIITTAPTWNQVENVLWAEIRKKYKEAKVPLGGELLQTKLKFDDKWMAIGFSPKISSEDKDFSTFQGFHNKWVIIIFEEATGIHPKLFTAAEGMMVSANVKWICIGNPTDPTSYFASLFKKPDWHKIKWSCFHSPNLAINGINDVETLRTEVTKVMEMKSDERLMYTKNYRVANPQLLTTKWAIDMYMDWGEESPLFQSKVLGEFPEIADDTLFSLRRTEECMKWDSAMQGYTYFNEDNTEYIACDVARFGDDKSVIFGLRGNKKCLKRVFTKKPLTFLFGELKQIALQRCKYNKVLLGVDDTGVGGGLTDMLMADPDLQREVNVTIVPIIYAEKAVEEEKYFNKISELWWTAAQDMKKPEGFVLDMDEILLSELTSRKYTYDNKGRIRIESKDDYKRRIKHSPDHADAFVMANGLRHTFKRVGSPKAINEMKETMNSDRPDFALNMNKW